MQIVRLVATCRDSGLEYQEYRLVLVCGVTEEKIIEDGEWFGYTKNDYSTINPFVLQNKNKCLYGGDEHYYETINIGDGVGGRLVDVGCMFTVFSNPKDEEKWEATYEIISCHAY